MAVSMGTEELLDRIESALSDYNPRRIDHPTASAAAVLILVHPNGRDTNVIFTERSNHVGNHKGQIAFPGGACDDIDDCAETTALRETHEEIGVQRDHVRVIGSLDDMVTVSNFRVTPFVGVLQHEHPYPFTISDHEVAKVVEVPMSFLLEETNMELEVRQHNGREVLVPAFQYKGHRIWGATARMLHQLIELLR